MRTDLRPALAHSAQQTRAVHLRHAHVGHDDVEAAAATSNSQRARAAVRRTSSPSGRAGRAAAPAGHRARGLSSSTNSTRIMPRRAFGGRRSAGGSRTPCPAPTSARSRRAGRACRSTMMELAIASPWPVPLPTSLVVKNGSKMRSRFSCGIPQPLSAKRISDGVASDRGGDRDAPGRGVLAGGMDGMCRVDDEIHEHLIQLADVAHHLGGSSPNCVSTTVAQYLYSLRATIERRLDGAVEVRAAVARSHPDARIP